MTLRSLGCSVQFPRRMPPGCSTTRYDDPCAGVRRPAPYGEPVACRTHRAPDRRRDRQMAEQTESSITVAAPPEAVMAVIADLPAYPEWNAEMKQVQVQSTGTDGRPELVRFVLDAGAIKDDYTLRYTWEGERGVRWKLEQAGMLTAMDGSYRLRPAPGGGTEVTYRLLVDVRIPMIGMIKRKAEKVIVDRALKGLKKRVEG